jgi:hypothetical protein
VVPTIISQLLDWQDPKADSRAAAFQRIPFLRSSSAPLSPSLHREFIDKFKLPLIQAMGSSEAGNVFSNPVPPGQNKIGSPGLPWGFEARIVDREGLDVPVGEPGEVLLRGDGMTQGYYKDPVGTAAAFDSEGWLHTGDLAYRDEDGYFFMIGRSKELIIKGGVNIAPKQIDEILESHPAVLEAAAVGVPDRHVGEDVVAFAVLRNGTRCDERELLSFCESHLGYFKTPARIYFVADLPKGPSGKVRRLRLTEEAERLTAAGALAQERSGASAANAAGGESGDGLPLERIIIDIWVDLLAAPHIGPDSNFFALGGQSLQAIQCLSRLREKASVLLSLSDFFENADGAFSMQRMSTSLGDSGTLIRFVLSRVPTGVKHRFNSLKSLLDKVANHPPATILPSGYFDEQGVPIDTLVIDRLGRVIGRLWHPRPLDAAGVLIRADNSEDMLPGSDPAHGWAGLFARGLEIVQTTGDHHSMVIEDNAVILARQMNSILDRYEDARDERAGAPGNKTDHGGSYGQRRFGQAPSQPKHTVV